MNNVELGVILVYGYLAMVMLIGVFGVFVNAGIPITHENLHIALMMIPILGFLYSIIHWEFTILPYFVFYLVGSAVLVWREEIP